MQKLLTTTRRARHIGLIFLLCTLFSLTACSKKNTWQLTDVHQLMPPLAFSLVDSNGKTVAAENFRGHITLLFFGYVHCSDVCPTTLLKLTQALSKIGKPADSIRILFVTLDPERDSLESLQQYTHTFGSQIVGLRPRTDAELQQLVKRYRVSYGEDQVNAQGDYSVSHSNAVYIFDRQGTIRLVSTAQADSNAIAHDLKQLLDE